MKKAILFLSAAVALSAATPAPAIDFGLGLFKKKSKPESGDRAKAFVTTLQSDPDEKKRKTAAEELRSFDTRTNPDVMTALITALQRDPSSAVRIEAAESIGKLKPVMQPAGIAMESALQSDPDPKVREAISSALWQYHLNGYRTPPAGNPLGSQTSEPPIASRPPVGVPPATMTARTLPTTGGGEPNFRPITNSVGKGVFYQPTAEPPLARPKPPGKTEVTPPSPSLLPPPMPSVSVPDPSRKPIASTPVPTPSIPPVTTAPPPTIAPPTTSVPSGLPSIAPPPTAPVPSIPATPLPPVTIPVPGGKTF